MSASTALIRCQLIQRLILSSKQLFKTHSLVNLTFYCESHCQRLQLCKKAFCISCSHREDGSIFRVKKHDPGLEEMLVNHLTDSIKDLQVFHTRPKQGELYDLSHAPTFTARECFQCGKHCGILILHCWYLCQLVLYHNLCSKTLPMCFVMGKQHKDGTQREQDNAPTNHRLHLLSVKYMLYIGSSKQEKER